ncbi:putative 5-O-(4-coumaroyl)-D-quinate 3'-monooxygenase [Lupinus albus]|uniref:Putative 5-O-(4-coumaroyl)-D-quinate 3'-monooxygenase n=1 Tax=Lupinus albus TaxID=3870 RepID=A0A6A4QVL2_LUPAL|nr:putative 5-O-(4-coumaroyl)-D-quinate 3'-monooxygenase [Lupinus albus]
MANLVKYPHMQQRIVDEITRVMTVSNKGEKEEVQEEDLEKLPYLKAVVLESLRRHPPGHFVLPHTVTEDVAFNGYMVPKNGLVNFMVAEIGRDPKVWEDPMTLIWFGILIGRFQMDVMLICLKNWNSHLRLL